MLIADSSFLVALFLPNDTNHEKAKKEIEESNEEIFISSIILYETLTVINYKAGAERKKETYDIICANNLFRLHSLDEISLQEILDEFVMTKNKLSFADISVVYCRRKMRSNVLSFDRELMKNLN